ALLGYIAGEIALADPAIHDWVEGQAASMGTTGHGLGQIAGIVCALGVVGVAWTILRRRKVPAL
ncbi:MAG TPA: TerC family protein, partial [Burkholderiaceae bacterium]|nr:TerC family protein [Burkholderiaceae bacterium]